MRIEDVTRDVLDGRVSEPVHARGRERMLAAVAVARRKSWRSSGRVIAGLLAACLTMMLVAYLAWPRSVLTFVVEGGAVARSGGGETHVTAGDEESVARFSDGSTVRFAPRSSGRIAELDSRGARVVLTRGEVHLDIVPRASSSWSVEAGAHVVRVTGTEFDVSWDPVSSSLRVTMQRGSVLVEGPVAPSGLSLHGGQSLEVGPDGVMHIDRSVAEASRAAETSEAAPLAAAAAPAPSSGAPSASGSSSATGGSPSGQAFAPRPLEKSWAQLVAAGSYKEVVSAARARGLDGVAEGATLGDLIALADAARYEKDAAAARASLEAQRKRFPTTQAGRSATFVLGRMAEDSDGNVGRAIALYDEYLATGGPFAAEALGRKMLAVRRSRGDAAARAIAAAYLESYPHGSYASAARSIVEAP